MKESDEGLNFRQSKMQTIDLTNMNKVIEIKAKSRKLIIKTKDDEFGHLKNTSPLQVI